ncbi:cryptochrome/photolyase family protein [Candidatus Cytomitobacter indipagum]|uniref:cryptochrome/photolyase family protein n=1 Tax=Candidatus Cytomitobacter indipagum TaxID=2601575 RepID=UPI001C0F1835|nr:deoxyribodipyrimidine photo-lyase [Candidatus Cytomitobacter indipagum]
MKKISIAWFRQDLRLSDNLSVVAASNLGDILPIYILDDYYVPDSFKIGSASKIWLHHSLDMLNKSLNGNLNIYSGVSSKIIEEIIEKYNVSNVFCNLCYEPWSAMQANDVKMVCNKRFVNYKEFNSNYLWNPDDILKNDQSYYKVFSAYKNKSYLLSPRKAVENLKKISTIKDIENKTTLLDLDLIPMKEKWHQKILESCDIGEMAAQNKFSYFVKNKLSGYKKDRDYPAKNSTSLLSAHLHFGEISPSKVWEYISNVGKLHAIDCDIDHFLSEIIWREFSCYLLHHSKNIHKDNFNSKFDNFPWKSNEKHLKAWQYGNTGYPIIDAGMRQLWKTGYMHNRIRMVTASFLVKNLNIHWHEGRDWFWDCLVDADLANNSASWQWVAGSGVDASPYFRIFNPIIQGEKFDKHGDYTKKFVPELSNLPDKYLFKPWEATEEVLKSAGIILGETYPNPIVDLADSRNKALDLYRGLK